MDIDLRDLYDLETIISESLLVESRDLKVVAWVSGTRGFTWSASARNQSANGTLTLEIQLLVPETIHDRYEEQLREYFEIDEIEPEIASIDPNNPDSIKPYDNPEKFIKDSLDPGVKGQLIREWCRYYSVHTNPLATGLCPTMDSADFTRWVQKWRSLGYSTEGHWVGGGQRHTISDEECPWCAARFKKGVATGSPDVPAPPLTEDTRRKALKSRFGSLGRSCGDPVRPLSFRTTEIGTEGGKVEVRGKKNTKLWYSSRFKDMAKFLMRRYRKNIMEAIEVRLGIFEDSPLYELIFGERTKKNPIPSNFKIYIADGRTGNNAIGDGHYVTHNYGQTQDLQALLYNSYSPDAPGPSFTQYLTDKKSGVEKQERVSFVDLDQLESHFVYNYYVDIYLDQSTVDDYKPADREIELDDPDETETDDLNKTLGGFDLSGFSKDTPSEPITTIKFDTFMNRLESIIEEAIPDRVELYGYWVDKSKNVFTVMKIPTGLEGLNFLIDPFLPMKNYEMEQWREADEASYRMIKLLPSISPAWRMGGRDNQIVIDTLNEYLQDRFSITLAPYDQYKPYPIGPDGSIYFIREDDLFTMESGEHVIGKIVDEDEDKFVVEQLRLSKGPTEEDVTFQGVFKKKPQRITKSTIVISKSQIVGISSVDLESRDYVDLSEEHTTSDHVTDILEKKMADIDISVPGEEYINRLKEKYGEKYVDKLGIIDADDPGRVYEWTNPRLWSRETITRLSTPREYVDREGRFFHYDSNNGVYVKPTSGLTYPWPVIEDRSHPQTPYTMISSDQYIHALDDFEFQQKLKSLGMYLNPLTSQWEASAAFPFYDANGTKKVKWIRFNDAMFWVYHAGKRYDQMAGSFVRTTANTGKKYQVLSDDDPSEIPIGIKQWTKDWYALNNRRIRKTKYLFPSPYRMPNPPSEIWEEVGQIKGLEIPPGIGDESMLRPFWPCRQGCGDGCEHCEQPYVEEYYTSQRGLDPDDSMMVRINSNLRRRDLWTGKEWLAYLVALRRWDNTKQDKDESKLGKNKIRMLQSNFYKGYDLFCLQHKIKREKGQPVDLSELTEIDKLMLIANWQGGIPRSFDEKLIDDFITGMRAMYTELFYRVMPESYREIMVNTVTGDEFRPDLLIDDVSFLEEYNDQATNMSVMSKEQIQQVAEAVKRKNARRQAKVEVSSPSDVEKPEIKSLFTEIIESEDEEQYDPSIHSLEAQMKQEEEEDLTEIDDPQELEDWEKEYLEQMPQEYDPDTGEPIEDPESYDDVSDYNTIDSFEGDDDDEEQERILQQLIAQRENEAQQEREIQAQKSDAEEISEPETGYSGADVSRQEIQHPGGQFNVGSLPGLDDDDWDDE